ncbi:MAG: hypothetical protein RLZ79_2121 [Pseudomonadota bacterium]|jgi:hypothetical protein
MRAVRLPAVPVNHERVVGDFKAVTLGNSVLTPLDIVIHELFDVSAIDALDVIMVRAFVELEDRHTVGEMVSGHETCGLELGQHAIDGCKTDVLTGVDQTTVDIFG